MKPIRHLLVLLLLTLCAGTALAANAPQWDSLRVSLITVTPGDDSYNLYGHTALRVQDGTGRLDAVFNYGAFSFDDQGFLWKFMRGDTNYTLAVEATKDVVAWYTVERRYVIDQPLDLTYDEAKRLFRRMYEEAMTPGWSYHYNFLGDNCATRPLGMIEAAIGDTLRWQDRDAAPATYRELIHRHVLPRHPWSSFGQDLLLGASLDTLVGERARTAFPMELLRLASSALRTDTAGTLRPLVLGTDTLNARAMALLPPQGEGGLGRSLTSPVAVALIVLLIAFAVSYRQIKGQGRGAEIYDIAAMVIVGLAGLLAWFEFFFSALPGVDTNCLVLLLQPLPLVWWLLKYTRCPWGGRSFYIAYVQAASLLLTALALLISGQKASLALSILALSLLLRTLAEFYTRRQASSSAANNTHKNLA